MTIAQIDRTKTTWPSLADTLHVPHSKADYQGLVTLLDSLVDEVGENENHPLASLMEVIGVLIEKYENEHVPELRN
jgi:HTH-type transcriptional regulator/antitoxin HigA